MGLTSRTDVSAWLTDISVTTYWHPTLPILTVEVGPADGGTGRVQLSLSPEQVEQLSKALADTPSWPRKVSA